MADRSSASAAAGSGPRPLPPGAGARLRRGYLLMALVTVVLLVCIGAVAVLAASTVARGERGMIPALLGCLAASGSLLLYTLGTLVARSAVAGDLVNVGGLGPATRSAVLGQVFAAVGAAAALVSGLLIASGGGPSSALWSGIGFGIPVAVLWTIGSSLRKLVARTAAAGAAEAAGSAGPAGS